MTHNFITHRREGDVFKAKKELPIHFILRLLASKWGWRSRKVLFLYARIPGSRRFFWALIYIPPPTTSLHLLPGNRNIFYSRRNFLAINFNFKCYLDVRWREGERQSSWVEEAQSYPGDVKYFARKTLINQVLSFFNGKNSLRTGKWKTNKARVEPFGVNKLTSRTRSLQRAHGEKRECNFSVIKFAWSLHESKSLAINSTTSLTKRALLIESLNWIQTKLNWSNVSKRHAIQLAEIFLPSSASHAASKSSSVGISFHCSTKLIIEQQQRVD